MLLSYPLHRPGHPEELRTEHWSKISCPVLVLSGDRDQFARVDPANATCRIGQPDEVVGLALLLASGAGSYLTGSLLALDGGGA